MKNVAEIRNAKTAELVAYWNEHHASKPIKKFLDRATAERRCIELLDTLLDMDAAIDRMTKEAQAGVRSVASLVPAAAAQRNPERKHPNEVLVEEAAKAAESCPACGAIEDQTYYNDDESANCKLFCHRCSAVYSRRTRKLFKAAKASTSRSEAIARSWLDSAVKADRAERCAVTVDGKTYKSVPAAFRVLGLPMSRCIAVRMEVKRSGSAVFGELKFLKML
jgi:hypothetical protein